MRTLQSGLLLSMMTWCGCCASFASSEAYAQSVPKASTCYVLGIQGMTCGGCAVHVQQGLSKVPGVGDAKVSYENGEASVCVKEGATVTGETLVKAVEKVGYKAKVKRRFQN
ncbi:MAG: cation transporter [Planctomycetia bacterium]|nr:cation transporter [Planctomycetia bacterium]